MKEEEENNVSENNSKSSIKGDSVMDESKTEIEDNIVDEKLQLVEENKKLNDLLLRSKAELENFQKRTIKQMQQAQLYSTEKLSSELLIIMDSLEAAEKLSKGPSMEVENFIEGNSLLLKTAKEIFIKLDIEEINPMDKEFDPECHQAMATKSSEKLENIVLEVMQKGYKLKTKLLRPALVVVSKKNE